MRPLRPLERPEPRFFDRTLSSIIHQEFPEFDQGIVPDKFKNMVLFDVEQNSKQTINITKRFKKLGIKYRNIGFYLFITKEDWHLFKLCDNNCPEEVYDGAEIGPLLLNEIKCFPQ